ncbi:cholesterol oxidase [Labilithrix luteola]|uniref:Cholesterol oxidase n=1 Tax=Labilithrix luteola TaxID=1391654 RepID=A0A0K1Q2N7_9BACT|nr:cholesterol oxidase [Labilithrix luteola]
MDVIVVGSGFGGSVCAARLAERGLRTLILERGPWWGPLQRDRAESDRRELPRGALGARKLVRNLRVARRGRRRERLYNADGLLEGHLFEHLTSVTASGVGGGSHIYTAILEQPDAAFFDAFPPEITAAEMGPYFERVREMLRPQPVPMPSEKDRVFAQAVADAGLPPSEHTDLAIAWGRDPAHPEAVVNAAGVEQRSSTFTGDVFVGCRDGSKTTLDLTYVPWALRHGAELRPLCEVLAIARGEGGGYTVRYRDHRSGQTHEESAPRLVLAAGGLNTQRLLFDARDGHGGLPGLPATLGRHFSPNADFAALLWRTTALHDSSYGPSFGALSRIHRDDGDGLRFVLGEVGLPVQELPLPGLLRNLLRRSTMLFCMGRDGSTGTLAFDGVGLTTSVGRSLDPALYDEMESALMRVAHSYHPRRTWPAFLTGGDPDGLFTVHPLGGCSMGRTAEDGFTDHLGQVFGHPGLYVADGSLYPRSPGIGPSMTIAALAERVASLMA